MYGVWSIGPPRGQCLPPIRLCHEAFMPFQVFLAHWISDRYASLESSIPKFGSRVVEYRLSDRLGNARYGPEV